VRPNGCSNLLLRSDALAYFLFTPSLLNISRHIGASHITKGQVHFSVLKSMLGFCPDNVTITADELKAMKANIVSWEEFAERLNRFFDPWKVVRRIEETREMDE